MSRSYKKHLWFKDNIQGSKREANKIVRRTPEIASGKAYRKVYNSYDICDFKIQHDHYPRWCNWSQEWIDPIPLWKAKMK